MSGELPYGVMWSSVGNLEIYLSFGRSAQILTWEQHLPGLSLFTSSFCCYGFSFSAVKKIKLYEAECVEKREGKV